jgi:heat shock protein HslJ
VQRFGGSYSDERGKLKITDIISTMRACQEPTPQFEKNFFATLEGAVSAKEKGDALVLTDKDGHYLRFSQVDR